MERAGEVVRLARGLYQIPDAALDAQQSLAEAARLVPKVVICPASALAFHGLTAQMPPKVWIAIVRKGLASPAHLSADPHLQVLCRASASQRRTQKNRRHARARVRNCQDGGGLDLAVDPSRRTDVGAGRAPS